MGFDVNPRRLSRANADMLADISAFEYSDEAVVALRIRLTSAQDEVHFPRCGCMYLTHWATPPGVPSRNDLEQVEELFLRLSFQAERDRAAHSPRSRAFRLE